MKLQYPHGATLFGNCCGIDSCLTLYIHIDTWWGAKIVGMLGFIILAFVGISLNLGRHDAFPDHSSVPKWVKIFMHTGSAVVVPCSESLRTAKTPVNVQTTRQTFMKSPQRSVKKLIVMVGHYFFADDNDDGDRHKKTNINSLAQLFGKSGTELANSSTSHDPGDSVIDSP